MLGEEDGAASGGAGVGKSRREATVYCCVDDAVWMVLYLPGEVGADAETYVADASGGCYDSWEFSDEPDECL